jgi:uncharacterized membrane protein
MLILTIITILFGIAVRVALSMHACGSFDIAQTFFWGTLICERGFVETYATVSPYPSHAPLGFALQGLFAFLAGGVEERFGVVFRLITSASDLLTLGILARIFWRRDRRISMWLVMAWAVMPYIVIQASFHTNLDPLVGLLLLVSALLDRKRPGFSGAVLGFAACIKIPALFPLAALAAYHCARGRDEGYRFCCGASIPIVLFLLSPIFFIPNYVSILFLRYRGIQDSYGLWAVFPGLEEVNWLSTILPLGLMVLAAFIACWRVRHGQGVESAELMMCALMPVMFASRGFGIQYFYWIVPLLALASGPLWAYGVALLISLSLLNLSMIWELLNAERCMGPLGYRHLDWLGVVSGGDITTEAEVLLAAAVWVLCTTLWAKLLLRM